MTRRVLVRSVTPLRITVGYSKGTISMDIFNDCADIYRPISNLVGLYKNCMTFVSVWFNMHVSIFKSCSMSYLVLRRFPDFLLG